MANRYWVGGTANWDATAGTKWATTSGGTGGAAVPTSVDDVFFDANSGSGTITLTQIVQCGNINFTGFTGTLTGAGYYVNVYGTSIVCAPSATVTINEFRTNTAGTTITTNNAVLGCSLRAQNSCDISGDLECTGLSITGGTFNTNNYEIVCNSGLSFSGATTTVNLGSSIVYASSVSASSNATLNAGTSEIIVSPLSFASSYTFFGGGKTYNKVTFADGLYSGPVFVYDSSTFAEIKSTKTNPYTLSFQAGTTNTSTTWGLNGSFNNVLTIRSQTSGSQYTLAKSGGGTVNLSYIDIKDCVGSPVSTWTATNSTNSGNNTNWTIYTTGPSSGSFFVMF